MNLYLMYYATLFAAVSVASCSSSSSEPVTLNDPDAMPPITDTSTEVPPQAEDVATVLYDDFSADYTTLSIQDNTTGNATGRLSFGGNSAVGRVVSQDRENQQIYIQYAGVQNSAFARMAVLEESIIEGSNRVQAQINLGVYNDTADGGIDGSVGDVGFFLRIDFRGDGTSRFLYGAYRFNFPELIEADEHSILDGESFHIFENLKPLLGVSYRLGISVDRENRTVTFNVDDNIRTFDLPTPLYEPIGSFIAFYTQNDRGPGTAVVSIDEIGAGDFATDISEPQTIFRYDARDANRPNDATLSVNNGELQLESVSTGRRSNMRLRVTEIESTYVGATIRLSGQSIAADGGEARARVGGSYYYGLDTPQVNSLLGQVFAVTDLVLKEDGSTEARYCAWQSTNSTFTEFTSLTNPDNDTGCNTFTLTPVLDQNYALATWLDEQNQKLMFSIDDEVHEQIIQTPIILDETLQTQLTAWSAGNGSRSVVFADNLRVVAQ